MRVIFFTILPSQNKNSIVNKPNLKQIEKVSEHNWITLPTFKKYENMEWKVI